MKAATEVLEEWWNTILWRPHAIGVNQREVALDIMNALRNGGYAIVPRAILTNEQLHQSANAKNRKLPQRLTQVS